MQEGEAAMDARLLEYDRRTEAVEFDPEALSLMQEVLNDFKNFLDRIFRPPEVH